MAKRSMITWQNAVFSAVKWLRRHVAGSGVDIKTTGFVWGE